MNNLKQTILLTLMLFATISDAASFDCSKAMTYVERTICADAELSKLDDLLAVAYKKALTVHADSADLKSHQRGWLKNVRNQCQDTACIKEAYIGRLADLGEGAKKSANDTTPISQQTVTVPSVAEASAPDALVEKYSKSLKISQSLLAAPIVFELNGEVIPLPQYDNLAGFIDVVSMMDNATGLVNASYKISRERLIVSLSSYDPGKRQKTLQTLTFRSDKSSFTGVVLAVVEKIVVDDGTQAYQLEKAEYLTYFISAF